MNKYTLFAVIYVWLILLFFLGRRQLNNPNSTSKSFAFLTASHLSILKLIIYIFSSITEETYSLIGLIMVIVTFVVAYPISYYSFPFIKRIIQSYKK